MTVSELEDSICLDHEYGWTAKKLQSRLNFALAALVYVFVFTLAALWFHETWLAKSPINRALHSNWKII